MTKPHVTKTNTVHTLSGVAFLDIDRLEVYEWCPDDKAELPPEQVHLCIYIKSAMSPLIMRFKSTDTLDAVLKALMEHRRNVWPSAPKIGED